MRTSARDIKSMRFQNYRQPHRCFPLTFDIFRTRAEFQVWVQARATSNERVAPRYSNNASVVSRGGRVVCWSLFFSLPLLDQRRALQERKKKEKFNRSPFLFFFFFFFFEEEEEEKPLRRAFPRDRTVAMSTENPITPSNSLLLSFFFNGKQNYPPSPRPLYR